MVSHLQPYFKAFINHMKTVQGQDWEKERRERRSWFQQDLSKTNIANLDEETLASVIGSLWANALWVDKTWLIGKIMDNGLDNVTSALQSLLHGSNPLAQRFDDFRNNIKHVGPASMTEIMAFVHPDDFPIWNETTKQALIRLGLDNRLPARMFKYPITGDDYEKAVELLRDLKNLLRKNGVPEADYIELDFFLAFVVFHMPIALETPIQLSERDFDHDELCEKIAAIGTNLGFEVETKKRIAKGAEVDVYWSVRMGNLGAVSYVFEVQKSGSSDSLILNLQRALNDPKVQRVVTVGSKETIEDLREEVESLSEDFRKRLVYLEVEDVQRVGDLLTEAIRILAPLKLSPS